VNATFLLWFGMGDRFHTLIISGFIAVAAAALIIGIYVAEHAYR
jgi:hypothetical protein